MFAVIEFYPEGTTWTHTYRTEQEAIWGIEDLRAAHAGRRYEMFPVPA